MENAIENGIRLDWFLAKGFKLAVGDNACFDSFEFKGITTIILPDEWNEPCDDDNKRFIKSFALRPVNSENPIPDGAPTTHTLIDNVMHWSFDFDALLKMYKEETEQKPKTRGEQQEMLDKQLKQIAGVFGVPLHLIATEESAKKDCEESRKEAEEGVDELLSVAEAAIKTMEHLNYTYSGGDMWEAPIIAPELSEDETPR